MSNYQLFLENTDQIDQLVYAPLEKVYVKVQVVKVLLVYLVLMAAALIACLVDDFPNRFYWIIGWEVVWGIALLVNLYLLPKAVAFKGYAIREHDITYRSGLFFPSVTTIPFSKIQQVSIRQNPVARIFRLHAVEVVNGAQMLSSLTIPGLTEEKAQEIKSLVENHICHE